jgi:hypothetical protein
VMIRRSSLSPLWERPMWSKPPPEPPKMLVHPFPLRRLEDGRVLVVSVTLPVDLTTEDADRLNRYVMALSHANAAGGVVDDAAVAPGEGTGS